jgi:hypothetical protein
MFQIKLVGCLLVACVLWLPVEMEAQEHGRVKWKRPTQAETARMASELAMADSILRSGD